MNLKHRKVEIFFGKYRIPEGLPIRNNNQNKIDCRPNPTNIEGPQHHGPRKCYTPRCTSAEPPKNKKQRSVQNPSPHEAATAPPRRRRGKRRLDERSAQARGARGEAVQAGERRRSGHRAASPQVASRSNLDSLKSGQRLGLPRIDVLCVNSFRSRERFNK